MITGELNHNHRPTQEHFIVGVLVKLMNAPRLTWARRVELAQVLYAVNQEADDMEAEGKLLCKICGVSNSTKERTEHE